MMAFLTVLVHRADRRAVALLLRIMWNVAEGSCGTTGLWTWAGLGALLNALPTIRLPSATRQSARA